MKRVHSLRREKGVSITTRLSSLHAAYLETYALYEPLWPLLTAEASLKVRKGNYERVFDEGRRRVRAWEKANTEASQ